MEQMGSNEDQAQVKRKSMAWIIAQQKTLRPIYGEQKKGKFRKEPNRHIEMGLKYMHWALQNGRRRKMGWKQHLKREW